MAKELTQATRDWLKQHNQPSIIEAFAAGKLSSEKYSELQGEAPASKSGPTADDVFGGARVKKPSERFSTTKSVAKHVKTGEPVKDFSGSVVESLSQLEQFQIGCWMKHLAAKSGLPAVLSEFEREAVDQIYAESLFCGKMGAEFVTDLPGTRAKALLSDSISGGAELNPVVFDSAVVQTPLLHSQILPMVDVRDVSRGSTIQGAAVANPTVSWGVAEGTPASVFSTADLVTGIDASVHNVVAAVEVGLDLLSDSAADLGRILVENIGQRMLAELDRVVCVGNGSTEPEGLFTASGLTDIGNPSGGAGADPAVADYEELLFSVPKQYRSAPYRCAFIGSDVTYSRLRGVAVGASDQRRVFGMTHGDYRILEHPFLVSADVANNLCAFGALSRYRLWRRQGQAVRWEQGGRELSLKNLALLTVRGRFAGKVVDPAAFAFSDNWKA